MTARNPATVLVDSRGHEWRPAPTYQDKRADAEGWLLMASTAGEELTYSDVVEMHGFRDGRLPEPYLMGYIANREPKGDE